MKTLTCWMFVLITCLGLGNKAHALEFSPFSCNFLRLTDGNWYAMGKGYFGYKSKLGWNQSTPVELSTLRGHAGGEFGTCSYISSTVPDQLFINIKFVSGKNLGMPDENCSFSGEMVVFDSSRLQISANDSYLYASHRTEINGEMIEFLHVAGVQSSSKDPEELCMDAFNDVTNGKQVNILKSETQVENNRKFLPGQEYIR